VTRPFGVAETLAGKYRVVELLGRGGMGAVYRGEDAAGHSVAIKQLLAGYPDDEGSVERFRREARLAASVRHENVVAVIETGQHDGSPFIVFELVTGGTLKDRIRASGALPWREAASLGAGIARGLAAIHGAGLVHRDVKPENVLLDGAGRPLISDLGLARQAGLATGGSLTRTGELLGTLEYVAPEQVESARRVDSRADLYSFGATLHALLTGRPPFEGQGLALVKKHLADAPHRSSEVVSGIPRALDDLVLELLAKSPDDRPGSAIEVARRLDEIARGSAGSGRGKLAALAVAAVIAAAVIAWIARRAEPPAPPVPPELAAVTSSVARPAPADDSPPWFQKLDRAKRPPSIPKGVVVSSEPGEYVNVKDGSVLLFVPGGTFKMGWDVKDSRGKPIPDIKVHEVVLSPYFIGKLEVTRAQFTAFVNAKDYVTAAEKSPKGTALVRTDIRPPGPLDGIWRGGLDDVREVSWRKPQGVETDEPPTDDHPVVQVTWNDAVAYCEWAGLELPTEAQWERAASWDAATSTPHQYPWGNHTPEDRPMANLRDASMRKLPRFFDAKKIETTIDDGFPRTAPVGKFSSDRSPIGALDMGGNVDEWCRDVYSPEAYHRARPNDPCWEVLPEGGTPTTRVTRGGSWNSLLSHAVTCQRLSLEQGTCADDLGFRVARSIP
jgi:serine/threonine protein kinase